MSVSVEREGRSALAASSRSDSLGLRGMSSQCHISDRTPSASKRLRLPGSVSLLASSDDFCLPHLTIVVPLKFHGRLICCGATSMRICT